MVAFEIFSSLWNIFLNCPAASMFKILATLFFCLFFIIQAHFDTPPGVDPVALDLSSMGKGQVWVNGHHIGRYWTLNAPKDGCQTCDYRGAYDSNKCVTNCGNPTQSWYSSRQTYSLTDSLSPNFIQSLEMDIKIQVCGGLKSLYVARYHIPRSWLQASDNLLVIFEETEKNPYNISIKLRFTEIICAIISEDHYPPLKVWSHPKISNGTISLRSTVPEMHLKCDPGRKISSIEFASYGTPQGSCQKFSRGDCHAPNSLSVVSQVSMTLQ